MNDVIRSFLTLIRRSSVLKNENHLCVLAPNPAREKSTGSHAKLSTLVSRPGLWMVFWAGIQPVLKDQGSCVLCSKLSLPSQVCGCWSWMSLVPGRQRSQRVLPKGPTSCELPRHRLKASVEGAKPCHVTAQDRIALRLHRPKKQSMIHPIHQLPVRQAR